MVSEMGGGQPPSPAAHHQPAALDETHPVGAVTMSPPPSLAEQPAGSPAADVGCLPMPPPPSRSPSPLAALKPSAAAAAGLIAADHQPGAAEGEAQQQQPMASSFVPVGELGGSSGTASTAVSQQQQDAVAPAQQQQAQQHPACSEPSSLQPSAMDEGRPASPTGYESGDDMDVLSMRHCTNCTGPLWGHICIDCGHMTAHDGDIFSPTVAPAAAMHRPRLQGDALTVICWDERMELHEETGSSMHPERPDRVRAVMARLHAAELAGRCRRLPAREATAAEIEACHIPELLEAVDVLSEQSRLQGNAGLHFSSDTYVNQHTAMCAKLSAGACVDVATAVVRGEARAGVAVVRPPGHHAESNTAMGFCFFNNAGIAARAAQAAGAGRVLVVDWDVHHGNGTQHIFEGDASVLYCSLHRYDGGSFYPGTGAAHEVGEGAGEGYSVNVPWPCGGMRNADYLAAFHHVVLPIAYEYAPDLVIISAGFDAAEGDPIGGCSLTPECYAHMAAQLQLVAPTVALLEGGYNLLSTAKGTEAVLRVLLGERPPALPAGERPPCADAMATLAQVMRIQSRYWDCMRGLVQQQLKVLADAAARQEQLAAMKARRAEAASGAASRDEEYGDEDEDDEGESPRGRRRSEEDGYCADDADAEMEGDEEEDGRRFGQEEEEGDEDGLLGGMGGFHRRHRLPPPGMEGLEEEAGTPHQQFRGNSGWESDADLASGEEELSSEETSGQEGGQEGQEAEAAQQQQQQQWAQGSPDASPPRADAAEGIQAEGRQASDTLPISDSEGQGSGSTSDGHHPAHHHHSSSVAAHGLHAATAASLSPAAGDGEGAVVTPATEQLLAAASDTPACGPLSAQPSAAAAPSLAGPSGAPGSSLGKPQQQQQQQAWPQGLAVKAVVLKRPGHVASHQRLSPALLDDEAMQLVAQRGSPQAGGAADRLVPSEEQHQAEA